MQKLRTHAKRLSGFLLISFLLPYCSQIEPDKIEPDFDYSKLSEVVDKLEGLELNADNFLIAFNSTYGTDVKNAFKKNNLHSRINEESSVLDSIANSFSESLTNYIASAESINLSYFNDQISESSAKLSLTELSNLANEDASLTTDEKDIIASAFDVYSNSMFAIKELVNNHPSGRTNGFLGAILGALVGYIVGSIIAVIEDNNQTGIILAAVSMGALIGATSPL